MYIEETINNDNFIFITNESYEYDWNVKLIIVEDN